MDEVTSPEDRQPDKPEKAEICLVCGKSKKYGSYYCSRDCWATCPPILFAAARVVMDKQHLVSLRVAVVWLLQLPVNSRRLAEVLGVSHGTICRWRIEVIRRLKLTETLGVMDAPANRVDELLAVLETEDL